MNITAERNVIGSILINNDVIDEMTFLSPEMFEYEAYGRMFYICKKLRADGKVISPDAIIERVADATYPPETATEDIGYCYKETGTSITGRRYANEVFVGYRARVLNAAINRITCSPDALNDEIDSLSETLDSIRVTAETNSKPLPQIVRENKDNYFKDNERPRVMMGLNKLDDILGGFEGGDLILIGARPAVGKSAFAAQITYHFAEIGKKVGYYNLEMQEKQVYERFVASKSGIELTRIRRAVAYQNDEEERFKKANEYLEKQDNIIISTGAKRISEIRADAKKQQYDVIVIDYMQLVKPDRSYGANRYAEVGAISHAVKSLAMEMNIPVIGLCQLNRVSEAREDREPSMSELRESGDFEQDASVIMLLWNTDVNDRSRKCIKIDKSRQGKTGKVSLKFDGGVMRFTEEEDDGFRDVSPNYDVVFD